MNTIDSLKANAMTMRKQILDMAIMAKKAHLGGSLSCVEILATLYLGGVMKYDLSNLKSEMRDRLILSKGHASMALYSALNHAKLITNEELTKYHSNGYYLHVHPKQNIQKGIETSSGSLGQGLSLGAGIALGLKLKKIFEPHVFVILGDGECNEGSNWEASAFCAHKRLDNITVIIDKNKLQADGATTNILDFEPIADKWKAFGFEVIECDGHDFCALLSAFSVVSCRPKCIIADTIKGKGVSFMEGNKEWHNRYFSQKQYDAAIMEVI